jgi:hypothetical protein
MFAAAMCLGAGARAQELTISGRVVSADGAPMTMVFVYLDSLKLISRVDSAGDYVLDVPPSAAQGQGEKLVAMAAEHIRSSAPVKLAGAAIWRDFVLQVDTMPAHKRLHPRLSDGVTEKSSTDIVITGQVTDSTGVPITSADVRLQPEGFPAMTDDFGHYVVRIPVKMNGKTVAVVARSIGLAGRTDTVHITGSVTRHDFVLSKTVYSAKAEPLDSTNILALGLTDLRVGPHARGEREIRIRLDNGYFTSVLVRLVHGAGKTNGEMISFVPQWSHQDSAAHVPRSHSALRDCGSGKNLLLPCRVRWANEPDWAKLWNSLDSLDIWNIIDEGSLRKRQSMVLDGSQITAEMWDGQSYKAWSYATGVEDDGPGRAKVSAISRQLRDIDAPAEF